MERISAEDRETWEAQLEAPLPGARAAKVSQSTIDSEMAAFQNAQAALRR